MSDAEDAARYRWLQAQFKIQSERSEREIYVDTKGGFKRYTTEVSYWHIWQLQDEWRFGKHSDKAEPPTLNELIDEAIKESRAEPLPIAHSKSQQRRFAAQGVVTEGPHCPTCECGISVKSTAPPDKDCYIHGPGTFPQSEGCRCAKCAAVRT